MKVWFMFDNHLFEMVGDSFTTREQMEKKAAELFSQDGCGTMFVRDRKDEGICKRLAGRKITEGQWGVTSNDLVKFFDAVDEYANWEARG